RHTRCYRDWSSDVCSSDLVFGGIYESETAANSSYNSLQVSFTRRFAHNFSVQANYVWSKAIDLTDDQATSISNVSLSDSNNFQQIGRASCRERVKIWVDTE